jgi:hypothetical protein
MLLCERHASSSPGKVAAVRSRLQAARGNRVGVGRRRIVAQTNEELPIERPRNGERGAIEAVWHGDAMRKLSVIAHCIDKKEAGTRERALRIHITRLRRGRRGRTAGLRCSCRSGRRSCRSG